MNLIWSLSLSLSSTCLFRVFVALKATYLWQRAQYYQYSYRPNCMWSTAIFIVVLVSDYRVLKYMQIYDLTRTFFSTSFDTKNWLLLCYCMWYHTLIIIAIIWMHETRRSYIHSYFNIPGSESPITTKCTMKSQPRCWILLLLFYFTCATQVDQKCITAHTQSYFLNKEVWNWKCTCWKY